MENLKEYYNQTVMPSAMQKVQNLLNYACLSIFGVESERIDHSTERYDDDYSGQATIPYTETLTKQAMISKLEENKRLVPWFATAMEYKNPSKYSGMTTKLTLSLGIIARIRIDFVFGDKEATINYELTDFTAVINNEYYNFNKVTEFHKFLGV